MGLLSRIHRRLFLGNLHRQIDAGKEMFLTCTNKETGIEHGIQGKLTHQQADRFLAEADPESFGRK